MKIFTRTCIVLTWILFIFILLYFPSWKVLPTQEKSINVFAWGGTIDDTVLSKFEQETGIKVNISYYSSNEELQVKMRATGGVGYDLIMPSDYTVTLMIQEDLLKPLDHSKIHFWNDLNPALLNHEFDPNNLYSVPFEWEVYGLGIDRDYFANRPFSPSWKAIFDKNVIDYTIAVNNDPIEAVLFAALYLFGKTENLSQQEFEQIRSLLLEQRNWVEAYTDYRSDYYIATGNCPVALTISALIKRIKSQFPGIDFVLPKEGSFITIENFCITKASNKEAYAYQLLNYLYTKESAISHYENLGFFPAVRSPVGELDMEEFEKDLFKLTREDFNQFHFFKNVFPQQEVRSLWVEVKSF